MTLYDDMQEVFRDLAPEYAQGVIQLVSVTPGGGKPWKPDPATETTTTIDGFARGVSAKFIQRGLAVAGDTQVVFPAGTVEPTINDYVVKDGERYKVVNVIKVPDAGTVISYTLICRKGP